MAPGFSNNCFPVSSLWWVWGLFGLWKPFFLMLCQKIVLESNSYWIAAWTLFRIQGHWLTGLQRMYFRPGRAERAKHLRSFTCLGEGEIPSVCLDHCTRVLWVLIVVVVLVIQTELYTVTLEIYISGFWKYAAVLLEACKPQLLFFSVLSPWDKWSDNGAMLLLAEQSLLCAWGLQSIFKRGQYWSCMKTLAFCSSYNIPRSIFFGYGC